MATWTDEDLARLPAGSRYEVLDGALLVHPATDNAHRRLAECVHTALAAAAPPGWRTLAETSLHLSNGQVNPDVVVLRPGSPDDPAEATPADVALVVAVETPSSHRIERLVKPHVYAEAGVNAYWRVESTRNGAVAHLYSHPRADKFAQHRCVNPGETVFAEYPFEVLVAPSTWASAGNSG